MGDMEEAPPPDWAALYLRHRDAMYRVAARTLRDLGLAANAEDVVMAAMESLMRKPPSSVRNWEAMLVRVTKMRAFDLLKSAAVKHSSAADPVVYDAASPDDVEDEVIQAVDRQRASARVRDSLSVLDTRHRQAVWEYVAKGRPRAEVAAELGVTPARVNQMVSKALRQLKEAQEMEGVNS